MAVPAELRAQALPGQRWIQAATAASVILLAVIAAVVSYDHMHGLALQHGEGPWASALIPLSVDGMIVASSMSLLLDSRLGLRGGILPWALLIVGALASLAANIAVAEPTLTGRVIAAWPSFALTCSYELLMRQIRQSAAAPRAQPAEPHPACAQDDHAVRPEPSRQPRPASNSGRTAIPHRADLPAASAADSKGQTLQRQAWQWLLSNRRPDGSFPTGSEVARRFQRSDRWGRLVKSTGLAGQLGSNP